MFFKLRVDVGLSCVIMLALNAFILAPAGLAQPPGVSASISGPGVAGGGGIYADSQFQFDIYVNNTLPSNIEGIQHGFRV